jgi:hypothetical protein
MQVPLQLMSGAAHDRTHEPLVHASGAAQFVPALPPLLPHPCVAPQNVLFVVGSTHLPAQITWLPGHDRAHLPLLHASPVGHTVPQAPQWFGSLCSSTHCPLHSVSPPEQAAIASVVASDFWDASVEASMGAPVEASMAASEAASVEASPDPPVLPVVPPPPPQLATNGTASVRPAATHTANGRTHIGFPPDSLMNVTSQRTTQK